MASFPNWLTSESNVSVVTRKFTGDHFDYGTAVPEIILFPTIHESPFKLMQLTNGKYVKCIERPKTISVIPLSTGREHEMLHHMHTYKNRIISGNLSTPC